MSTTVATKIRIMRKSEMLTQEKMAEITGITLSALRQYEQGRNEPNLESTKNYLNLPYLENIGIGSYLMRWILKLVKSYRPSHTLGKTKQPRSNQRRRLANYL